MFFFFLISKFILARNLSLRKVFNLVAFYTKEDFESFYLYGMTK